MNISHPTLFVVESRFPLGFICATPGAIEAIDSVEMQRALNRHAAADWGKLDPEDTESNSRALEHGGRLFSAYEAEGRRFWIITEADRSSTTVLLPEEY